MHVAYACIHVYIHTHTFSSLSLSLSLSSSSHCSTPHQVRGWGNAPSRMSVRATESKQDPAIEGAQGNVDCEDTLEPRVHKISRT